MQLYRILSAGLLLLNTAAGIAQISDPIFAIPYDPNKVHFETAPALIGRLCPILRRGSSQGSLSVYAHLKDGDTEYYIVQRRSGDFGTAVAIRRARCTEVDSDRFLVEGINTLSEKGRSITAADNRRVMEGIAADILDRYSKAFGGKQNLLRTLGNSYDGMPPLLRRTLEQFKKTQDGK